MFMLLMLASQSYLNRDGYAFGGVVRRAFVPRRYDDISGLEPRIAGPSWRRSVFRLQSMVAGLTSPGERQV